ncbi:MAG: hypothetical protein ACI376_07665 [Candidatus Bruticola sp.]
MPKNNLVMLSSSYNRFLTWALVIGSAALCADIGAASLDAYFTGAPKGIEVGRAEKSKRSRLSSEQVGNIASALRQPVNKEASSKVKGRKSQVISEHGVANNSDNTKSDKKNSKKDKRDISKGVLQGSLIAPTARAAIFEWGPGQVEVIDEGERVGSYVLSEVDSAWARFENDQEEVLFVADSLSLKNGESEKSSGPIVKKRSQNEEEGGDSSQTDDKQDSGDSEQERVSMADIRRALDNSAEMAKQLRVVPQEKDGQPYGTRVDFRNGDNLLARMGVKNRDIMLSINGVPTRSAEEMYRGYMTLRNASSFEFVVERNGQEETIRYELEK